jgi:hypothetical protein
MVDQYVVPTAKGWGVREATSRDIARFFDSQDEAIAYASEIAKDARSAVFVKTLAGETEKRDSYRSVSYPVENHSIMIGNKYQPRHDD